MDTLMRPAAPQAPRALALARRTVDGTPRRLALLGAGLAALSALFALLLAGGVSAAHSGIDGVAAKTDEVSATNDLYFHLVDMDAQAANALLVGFHPTAAVPASVDADAAVKTYEADRASADADLQRIALNPSLASQYTQLLGALGTYEALIGEVLYIDRNAQNEAPASPPATALGTYQQASTLMHGGVLTIAAAISTADGRQLDAQYAAEHGDVHAYLVTSIVVGLLLAAALIAASRYLAARFRRVLSPGLLLALVAVLVLTATGGHALSSASGQLRTAKQDAFDSISALTHARALSYDANAAESRWLLSPMGDVQQDFFTQATQVASVPGLSAADAAQDPARYYDGLESAVGALALDPGTNSVANVRIGGLLGTELNNITFPGEAQAAVAAVQAYDAYVQDDATIRADANRGDTAAAVAFDIGTQPGQSNADYYRYDSALTKVVGINETAFRNAVAAGRSGLAAWTWLPYAAGLALLVLIGAALAPRLREYR
jgi:hypothetical protein